MRGDGHYGYSEFDTQTVNMLLSYKATDKDTITIKGINNELDTELPFRMSLNQYNLNPHQEGCARAAGAAAGCVISNFSRSGNTTSPSGGDIAQQTAAQAGANRNDRRTIGGIRWEHDFNSETSGRAQFVIDDRNISQPTSTTSAVGDYLSYNALAELSNRTNLGGVPATLTFAGFWNYLPVEGYTTSSKPAVTPDLESSAPSKKAARRTLVAGSAKRSISQALSLSLLARPSKRHCSRASRPHTLTT